MTDATSPWPERRRTQRLLLVTGTALLVPVALALAGVVDLSDTAVLGATTVAAALLVYGLLGWGGQWVEGSAAGGADEASTDAGGVHDPRDDDPAATDESDTTPDGVEGPAE